MELTWDFLVRFLSITLIDLALSGDNAIVIGMAAASLPRSQRRWAILGGSGLAIGLRVALALAADPEARRAFEVLNYSNRQRIVLGIEGAKAAETRQRRVEKAITDLRGGRVQP